MFDLKELNIEEMRGQALNLYLTNMLNAIFELANLEELEEITSLNYDGLNNRLVIGVKNGVWLLTEDSRGLRGVFYGE